MAAKALVKAGEDTGVARRLKAAGREFFALNPRYATEKEKQRTKYPVVFWLNPQQQDKYEAGWFTVEELDLWIQGRGPVLKQ